MSDGKNTHTIKFTVHFNDNFYASDELNEINYDKTKNDIKTIEQDIVNSVKNFFKKPFPIEYLEELINKEPSIEILSQIFSRFRIHGFNSTEDHIKILNNFNVQKLDVLGQIRYYILFHHIYAKKGEYSIALEYIEKAKKKSNQTDDYNLILNIMIAKGAIFSVMDHPETDNFHREIIEFANKNSLTEGLSWAYRNWGSFFWNKGDYIDALQLFRKETEYRKKEGTKSYIDHLLFLAEKKDLLYPSEAIESYKKVIFLNEKHQNSLSTEYLAEIYYRIVTISLRNDIMPIDELLENALKAYNLFSSIQGFTNRVAWAAGAVASCYEKKGNKQDSKKYTKIKKEYIEKYGSSKDKFKQQVYEAFKTNNLESLKVIETLAYKKIDYFIDWALIYSNYLLKKIDYITCIDFCQYSIEYLIINKQINKDPFGLNILYNTQSIAYLKINNVNKHIEALIEAVKYNPEDGNLRWKLCNNSFANRMYDLAEKEANYLLDNFKPSPGPYQILAHCEYEKGNKDKAIKLLEKAEKKFPDHQNIKIQIDELIRIKNKLLNPKKSKWFKMHKIKLSKKEGNVEINNKSLPEFRSQIKFYKDIINEIPNYIYQIQKTPPVFIKDFNKGEKELQEEDFRDELERQLSHIFKVINAEVKHGSGRADLIINSTNSIKEKNIIEFKIWPRNDYKQSVDQIIKYLTDFQNCGIVIMINPNKKDIINEYKEEIIFNNNSYFPGTFRSKPVLFDATNFDHFYSKHKTLNNKEINIFHFILNCN